MPAIDQLHIRVTVTAGPGAALAVPALPHPAGPVLAVVDPGLAANGVAGPVLDAWRDAGLAVATFTDFTGDPTAAEIDAARAAARNLGAATLLAIGGGSALDVAKLAAALLNSETDVAAHALGRRPFPERHAHLVAVPTTAGTGAEVTRTAVFSDDSGAKLWAFAETVRPDLAVLDPRMTVGLPPHLTAATGADAVVHAIEACTNTRANPLVDAWALHAIRLAVRDLATAVAQPDNLAARANLQTAACLAGLAIDACGTAVAHALGHALGTLAHVHHGRAVALGLRVALAANAAAAPARHAAVARAMGLSGEKDGPLADALAGRFDAFLRDVGVHVSLARDGLGPGDADRLTALVLRPENAPMRDANCRAVTPAIVAGLVRDLLQAV